MDGSVRLLINTAILVLCLPVMTLQGTTATTDTTTVSPASTTDVTETTSQTSVSNPKASPTSEPEYSTSTSDTTSTTELPTTLYSSTSPQTATPSYTTPSAIPVGSSCTNETQCMAPSTCNDSVCTCPEEYYQKDQECKNRVHVGGPCTNGPECVVNADCSNYTCQCYEDFFPKDMKCIPRVQVDQECNDKSECVVNAGCSNNTCTCLEDFFQEDMKCIPRVQVDQGCNHSAECVVNAVCSNNTCTCLEDFFQKDMKCIPRVSPGGNCTDQTPCVDNADCVPSNNTCQCKSGWMVNGSICTPKETRYVENLKASYKTSSSVLVTFDGPLDYNMFKLDVNTSDPSCIVLRRNASHGTCSECTIEDIDRPGDKRIGYNVTGLKAFTLYEMKVAMVKCNNGSSEGSRAATVTVRTDTAVPNTVDNLTTCRDSSCLVCARWNPPLPYPGPVTYRVDIFDEVNLKVVKETNETETSLCYTKEDVSPFLKYTIGVSAFTTAGQGMEIRTPSMEIQFLEFNIITAEERGCNMHNSGTTGNYKQMTIQWREPDIGPPITNYLVTANEETHNVSSKASRAGTEYRDAFNVNPGQTYTFKIQVRHDGTLYNVSSSMTCSAPIGFPPEWTEGLQPSPDVTDTEFRLNYIEYWNNDNGPITNRRVYIATDTGKLELSVAQSGHMSATRIGCCSGGLNEVCTTGYCIRHLVPDTVYYYVAVGCTKRGCKKSPIFDFRTDKDNTTVIVVAMLVTSFILSAFIIGAALIWRSKKAASMPVRISLRKQDLSRIPRERPMLLSELESRVTRMHADSNLQFSVDYENIIRISPKHTNHASQIDENKQKNRWVNVLPFDHSRVILQVLEHDETSDYINASYMPGYNYENEYIASQGPLPGTVDDFWRMIWEKKVSIIVMVTPVKENGKVKCEEYWPVEVQEPKEYGDIVVENTSFSSLNTYNVTVFQLRNGQDKDVRVVKHFHFLNWKDMSADVERTDILDFVRTVRSHLRPDMEGPIVVHCSAGVGRTGTFICLDYLIQFIEKHDLSDTVDIYGYVMKLRNNRVLMVQTETQYVFIHDCAKQLVEEKRLALERPDSVVDIDEGEEDAEDAEDVVYVNTEMGVPVMNDGMTGTEMTTCKDKTGDGCDLYENASTCHLIQQTEL